MGEISKTFDDPVKVLAYTNSLLRNSRKIVLFTESRNDDFLYEEFFEDENVALLPLRGKPKCKELAELCYNNGINLTASFTDDDYDWLFPKPKYNHITTDFFDLEAFSIFSSKWDRIIREIVSLEAIQNKFGIQSYIDFRKKVVDICLPVGVLMYFNQKKKRKIEFKTYMFDRKCKIPANLDNSISLVTKRLRNLNPSKIDSKLEDELIKEGEKFISSIPEHEKCKYVSSTLVSKCIASIGKTHNLFKAVKGPDDKKIVVLVNYLTLKGQFRSHVDEKIFYTTKMYKSVMDMLRTNDLMKAPNKSNKRPVQQG